MNMNWVRGLVSSLLGLIVVPAAAETSTTLAFESELNKPKRQMSFEVETEVNNYFNPSLASEVSLYSRDELQAAEFSVSNGMNLWSQGFELDFEQEISQSEDEISGGLSLEFESSFNYGRWSPYLAAEASTSVADDPSAELELSPGVDYLVKDGVKASLELSAPADQITNSSLSCGLGIDLPNKTELGFEVSLEQDNTSIGIELAFGDVFSSTPPSKLVQGL